MLSSIIKQTQQCESIENIEHKIKYCNSCNALFELCFDDCKTAFIPN